MTARLVAVAALAAIALAGCYREKREFQSAPSNSPPDASKLGELRPGAQEPLQPGVRPAADRAKLDRNAYAVNQGKRLFRWYNCSGCHGGGGGGGMGATLTDAGWRYGSEPAAIYATIVEGRPNGMPAFGGRIPEDQVWQLVAYVRSLSGQLRKDVAPSRSDALSGFPPENERDNVKPKAEAPPASSPP